MTNYLIKKHYGIETGFVFSEGGREFLVVDVITHRWNDTAKLHEALPDPFVVYRPLIFSNEIHERNIIDFKSFNQKYLNA